MLGNLYRNLVRWSYRVQVNGKENFEKAGDKVLVAINHGSLLDPILIGNMLPEKVTLIVDKEQVGKRWMRKILASTEHVVIDFSKSTATLDLVRAIKKYKRCMVFHEERVLHQPELMRRLEATALIAGVAGAVVLPVRIDGASYSRFTYSRHKVHMRWFPKITLNIQEPTKLELDMSLPPRRRRRIAAVQLYRLMTSLIYQSRDIDRNVLKTVMDAAATHGTKHIIAEDQERKTLTYGDLLTKAGALGRGIGRVFKGEKIVGFMMPGSLPGVVAWLGMHVTGLVPAMLNFTAGVAPVISGCKTVRLKSVLTSRKFIQVAELTPLITAMEAEGIRIVYLEDVSESLKLFEKIGGLLAAKLRIAPKTDPNEPMAVLYTSGTEGLPKAVFMSHRNANANREQLLANVDLNSGDRFFNMLPMFHTFGLGVGTLLPLCSGIRCVLYPSPLHYRQIPQLFYETLSTVICGTDTFFTGYARYGQPFDFFSARLAIVGGEKMRETTYRTYKEKFGVSLLEGYGATETSPVIAFNTPANNKLGTVGRILPCIDYDTRPVDGLPQDEGGELWAHGDNVMLGYMFADNPGVLVPPVDREKNEPGWYDTGDIVSVDEENFVTIKGRAKRFAKIGGEMISLAAVENALAAMLPDVPLGVISLPDARKGEQLVLIIQQEDVTTSRIAAYFASQGYSSLWTPKRIIAVKEAPLMGSGKFDYSRAKELAEAAELA